MEAKNPNTGNLEKVYVKALDSLPVGTEVDFTGSASDIPLGWEAISGQNKIKKTSETRAVAGKILNVKSGSTTDTYSSDYINDLIVTENVSVTNIAVNSKETVYKLFTIPSKAEYTPIAITLNSTGGAGSGYVVFTPTLEGYLAVYNGWTSNGTFSVSLKIIYLKN